nr:MAG TPA: hypothetical protein [Caudoviricetes sp.]
MTSTENLALYFLSPMKTSGKSDELVLTSCFLLLKIVMLIS